MIPLMHNTKEALAYGASIAGNLGALEALKAERARLVSQVKALMDAGRDGEALLLASGQSQFTREALEAAGLKG